MSWVQWLTSVIPALWEAKAGESLRSGVRDQPDQYGEIPSLLKIEKLAWSGGGHPEAGESFKPGKWRLQ